MINKVMQKMINFYENDPRRIQHFIKVHSFARYIGISEDIPTKTLEILEITALVHDIGIKPAEAKFGNCNGKLQEEYGPFEAETILSELGFDKKIIDRVCFLVGHHHTYDNISGDDYQILVEADFLVNFYEDNSNIYSINHVKNEIFKTTTGINLVETMFLK
ncbi:MAG: HD domain-containing protein [Clostridia bacterium]